MSRCRFVRKSSFSRSLLFTPQPRQPLNFKAADLVLSFVLISRPEKLLFPPVANTLPEHCLRCLLLYFPASLQHVCTRSRHAAVLMHHQNLSLSILRADAKHLSMEERCQKINIFIFGILFPWISTFGATRNDKQQKVVHKDRRAAML